MDTDLARLLHEQAPDAIIFADRDGLIRQWNAAAEAIFGFTKDEATGQSLDLIIPEEFRSAHWAAYEGALATGETKYKGRSLPTRGAKKDGATIYVELSFAIIRDPAGTVLGALAQARDNTPRGGGGAGQRTRPPEPQEP